MAPRSLALAVLLLALAAAVASAAPDIEFNNSSPTTGDTVAFSCTGCPDPADVTWAVTGDSSSAPDASAFSGLASHEFGTAGSYLVWMSVDGAEPVSKGITVAAPPPPPNRNPVVVIDSFTPSNPTHGPGNPVSFKATGSDPDGDTVTYDWDFDDGTAHSTEEDPSHTYGTSGPTPRTVTVTVSDGKGGMGSDTTTVPVTNRAPSVSFAVPATNPLPGATVSFSATASDPNGDTLTYAWAFGDGGAGNGKDVQHAYTSPGAQSVTVTVTDGHGGTGSDTKTVTVRNRPPVVSFDFNPVSPLPNDDVLFAPDVSDPDGDAVTLTWNFGSGSTKTGTNRAAYSSPGTRTVTLTATDARGAFATESRQITVRAPAGSTPDVPATPAVRFITPFPMVRIAGKVLSRATDIDVLAVRAPRGSSVRVTCKGKGCPVAAMLKVSKGRSVRFKAFERTLRSGIRLEIFVRQPRMIGKYTRFLIRAGKPPARLDRCLFPGTRQPRRCP